MYHFPLDKLLWIGNVDVMILKITANYPHNEVKDIIGFAEDFVFSGALFKLPDTFKVWVKNSEYTHAGRFYGHKISMRIGRPNRFPSKYSYPRLKTAPEYTMEDWKECLFVLAVHEFWHYYQMKSNSPYSEIETEKRAVMALQIFRSKRLDFDKRWALAKEKVEQRLIVRKQRSDHKETPQYEAEQLEKKIAKAQRRIKLYQTKLKKFLRRKRFLAKKIDKSQAVASV